MLLFVCLPISLACLARLFNALLAECSLGLLCSDNVVSVHPFHLYDMSYSAVMRHLVRTLRGDCDVTLLVVSTWCVVVPASNVPLFVIVLSG